MSHDVAIDVPMLRNTQEEEGVGTIAQGQPRLVIDLEPPRWAALPRAATSTRRADPGAPGIRALSRREVEVVELLIVGFSNAGIAARLYVSEKTVEAHIRSIFAKLGVFGAAGVNQRVTAAVTYLELIGWVVGGSGDVTLRRNPGTAPVPSPKPVQKSGL